MCLYQCIKQISPEPYGNNLSFVSIYDFRQSWRKEDKMNFRQDWQRTSDRQHQRTSKDLSKEHHWISSTTLLTVGDGNGKLQLRQQQTTKN